MEKLDINEVHDVYFLHYVHPRQFYLYLRRQVDAHAKVTIEIFVVDDDDWILVDAEAVARCDASDISDERLSMLSTCRCERSPHDLASSSDRSQWTTLSRVLHWHRSRGRGRLLSRSSPSITFAVRSSRCLCHSLSSLSDSIARFSPTIHVERQRSCPRRMEEADEQECSMSSVSNRRTRRLWSRYRSARWVKRGDHQRHLWDGHVLSEYLGRNFRSFSLEDIFSCEGKRYSLSPSHCTDHRCVFLDLGNLASYLLTKQLVARHTMRSVQTNENQFQFGRTPVTQPLLPPTFVVTFTLHSHHCLSAS